MELSKVKRKKDLRTKVRYINSQGWLSRRYRVAVFVLPNLCILSMTVWLRECTFIPLYISLERR